MAEKASKATAIHEMGHWLEYHVPGVTEAVQDFLQHRIAKKGDRPRSLNDVYEEQYGPVKDKKPYMDDEEGYGDDFVKTFGPIMAHYVGKVYKKTRSGDTPTEIMSMGLQQMYEDPHGFSVKDPEYFDFVVGILDGALRKHS